MSTKTIVDIVVVICYLLAVTGLGIWIGRRQNASKEGFFLGGRKFSWLLIGFSLFATNISSTQFVGQSGFAYKTGIAAANFQLIGGLCLGMSALIIIPLYLKARIYTLPEFLKRRYGSRAKLLLGFIYVAQSTLSSPIPLYAGGLVVLQIFDIDESYLWLVCLITGGTVALYALIGGLTSVVFTDLIQGIILIGGGLVVLAVGCYRVFIEGSGLNPDLAASHLELILPSDHPRLPWTVLVTGVIVHLIFWSTSNSGLLQRVLGAKDTYNAQCGMLLASFLKMLAVFIIVFPGILAAQLFPGINPDASFAVMVDRLLPMGISGLVMAGVIAALMSSSDSGVMAVSSIVAMDIYPSFRKSSTEKQALLVGRISAGFVLAFSIVVAPLIGGLADLIFPIVLKISSFMLTPIGVCFLFGRFSRRVNEYGAVATMSVGFLIGVSYVVLTSIEAVRAMLPDIIVGTNFYHLIFVLFFLYSSILLIVSYLTPAPSNEQLAILELIKDRKAETGRPWYQKYVLWYLVFVLAFIGVYWLF